MKTFFVFFLKTQKLHEDLFVFLEITQKISQKLHEDFFLTDPLFRFLNLFDCPGFLSKKYGKSNYNILKNCHYLHLKIVNIS